MPAAEIVIIGGGVIGLSLAYELARARVSCCVIERGAMGREASWAGAGILPPANGATAVHPYDQLRGLSFQLHAEWAEALAAETGIDTEYQGCGGVYLARTPGEAASLVALEQELRELDIPCERMAGERLAELEPELARDGDLRSGLHLPGEAQLRNPRHLRALEAACRQREVVLLPHTEVLGWDLGEGRIRGVRSSAGRLEGDKYCVTTGAWSHALLQGVGLKTGVLPIRGQMVMFGGERPLLRRIVNEGPRYLVPRRDGRLLAGSTEEEVGFDKRTTPEGIAELTEFARTLVPALREAPVERTWAGLRPGSFDGLPYLGRVPAIDNLWVAAGHFRSGLYLSTGTAVVLAESLRGLTPRVDLSPFSVLRG